MCAYVKRIRPGAGGRIYVQIAASPKSLEPTACRAFNRTFGGRGMSVDRMAETGRPYCGYTKSSSSYSIRLGVFAFGHKSGRTTGSAFCRSFQPGHGSSATFSGSRYRYWTRPGKRSRSPGPALGMTPERPDPALSETALDATDYRVQDRVEIRTFLDEHARLRTGHPTSRTPLGDTSQRLTEPP